MPMFPPNHAERYAMAEEVHARPPETVVTPARASYVAVLVDSDERGRERAHLEALCRRFAQPLPAASTTHHRVTVGTVRLKWERHGEFSGYLFIAQGAAAQPFAEPAATLVDADWLGAVPGRTIAATHVDIVSDTAVAGDALALAEHFGGHGVTGASIAERAASVFTDFRIHDDGVSRCLVLDHGLTRGQAGRTLQRLVEIEAYRMLALLALPIARRQAPRMLEIERQLALLTDGLAQGQGGSLNARSIHRRRNIPGPSAGRTRACGMLGPFVWSGGVVQAALQKAVLRSRKGLRRGLRGPIAARLTRASAAPALRWPCKARTRYGLWSGGRLCPRRTSWSQSMRRS